MSLEFIKQMCCLFWQYNLCIKENKNELCGVCFGIVIVVVKDFNFDGFNDIVIGVLLEDDYGGVVYIYYGSGKIIRKEYV